MRKILALLCLALASLSAAAQSLNTDNKAAEKLYYQGVSYYRLGDNKQALEYFKEAIRHDKNFSDAYWVMADVYKAMKNEPQRIATLKRVAYPNYPALSSTYQKLAVAQYENGLYSDALDNLNKIPMADRNQRIQNWINKCEFAQNLVKSPIPFDPKNLGPKLNTIYDDYWPSVTADDETMSTTVLVGRTQGSPINAGMHEEIFHSKKVNGQWTVSQNIGAPMNTPGNEGAQTFSFDGRYMFFVACDRKTSLGGCDIYYSMRDGDTWSEPINPGEPLNTKYWETTPCFSAAGDELYFSSNRPGGQGKKDLWKCNVKIGEDGLLLFSTPVNLGPAINTPEDEFSPFFHADNKTLYFSSTGHPGLGGYDIFMSRKTDSGWTPVKNLGYPLNTHRDEIGFVVNTAGDKAYFSSDGIQNNGRGKDIYEVALYPGIRPDPVKYFKGKIEDADTGKGISAHVEVYRLRDEKVVSESMSDKATGEFLAVLPEGEEYGFNVHKKGYLFHSGHFGEGNNASEIRIEKEVELPKIEIGRKITLRNVFFDLDSYHLKAVSRAELDRLAAFMKEYPRVKIELGGHTDNWGTAEHNVVLSQNRADAVKDYLVRKGIRADRLTCVGYGQDRPMATNDTDEGRALNRRTEAVIIEK